MGSEGNKVLFRCRLFNRGIWDSPFVSVVIATLHGFWFLVAIDTIHVGSCCDVYYECQSLRACLFTTKRSGSPILSSRFFLSFFDNAN
mmetsp:Transcript_45882/g.70170  ORF Transcript_45882/g.70170 Transcript_45882/m.70170 type:complete len:88 (-) Transcript_45882:10-273(-)